MMVLIVDFYMGQTTNTSLLVCIQEYFDLLQYKNHNIDLILQFW